MNVQLPPPVAAYLKADAAKDAPRVVRCFHDHATVRDEGQTHCGRPAIEAWYRDANARYAFVVEPLEASVDGSSVVVRTQVTGNFPGGTAELRCRFEVEADRISTLEITP